jgi:hypothetical protein
VIAHWYYTRGDKMIDISRALVIISGIMASIAFISALIIIIVSITCGEEAGREVLRMMLLC